MATTPKKTPKKSPKKSSAINNFPSPGFATKVLQRVPKNLYESLKNFSLPPSPSKKNKRKAVNKAGKKIIKK